MERTPDDELASQLCHGNREAWLTVYDRYAETIWRYVGRRLAGDPTSVADVVQETMLTAATAAGRYDPARGTIKQWLTGIARRQIARHYRNTFPLRVVPRFTAFWRSLRAPGTVNNELGVTEARAVAREAAETVREALSRVPPEQRLCLVEKYMEGRSLEEISRLIGRSTAAVSSLLARGRRSLRRTLVELDRTLEVEPGESHETTA